MNDTHLLVQINENCRCYRSIKIRIPAVVKEYLGYTCTLTEKKTTAALKTEFLDFLGTH